MFRLRHGTGEYAIAGAGDPLVLVPGLAGGYELLGRLVRALARRFRVICVEFAGEHDQFAGRARSLPEMADDLMEFLDDRLMETPTVVGVSFGSAVALEFALRHRGRARALVLQGLEGQFRNTLAGHIARVALEQFPLPDGNAFINQFFRLLFARREPVGPLLDYVTSRCWWTDQSVMAHRLRLWLEYDVRDRLADVTAPTLVIAGQDDAIVDPAGQEMLAAQIPGAHFTRLPNSGHLCFLTHPGAYARAVQEFLATIAETTPRQTRCN